MEKKLIYGTCEKHHTAIGLAIVTSQNLIIYLWTGYQRTIDSVLAAASDATADDDGDEDDNVLCLKKQVNAHNIATAPQMVLCLL